MENEYYSINLDTRFVLKSKNEVIAQKIGSMALDSKCLLLKGEACIKLIKFLMSARSYSEIKNQFSGDMLNISEVVINLIKYDIVSVSKDNAIF
ncbi:hypothetical protein ACQ3G7_07805 [Kosakonia oryzendophytica]|uniref:hypothetical protein n=1 Tax=Kosakonia oryzendophytica TaxID=1005665 RepID=UPI003D3557ED